MLQAGIPGLQTARAAAALPAAGVYDAAPTIMPCGGAEYVTLYVTYTRAGAGGSVRVRPEFSPYSAVVAGVENWFPASVKQVGAFAAGADTVSGAQRENGVLYTSTGVGAETFAYGPIALEATVERLRVMCQEVGAVATPGACHIVAVYGAEGSNSKSY
jgi:hypothetical protein